MPREVSAHFLPLVNRITASMGLQMLLSSRKPVMDMTLHDRIRERAYFLSLGSGGAGDGAHFWLTAEREVLNEIAMESGATSQLAETIQPLESVEPTAVLQQPAAEQPKKTAHKPPAAANGSALEAKARLISELTKATSSASTLRSATAATKHATQTLLPKLTLDELRDRISEDQITEGEVMAALREPLAGTDDGYVRSKLKQAITSASVYYSSRKWGQCRTVERAKARLIANLTKATA
jgi:hypothetical protein